MGNLPIQKSGLFGHFGGQDRLNTAIFQLNADSARHCKHPPHSEPFFQESLRTRTNDSLAELIERHKVT